MRRFLCAVAALGLATAVPAHAGAVGAQSRVVWWGFTWCKVAEGNGNSRGVHIPCWLT